MTDKDYLEIDSELDEEVIPDDEADDDDKYEKNCMICRRPESTAGPMIKMMEGAYVCHDCMQKSFETMNSGSFDFGSLMGGGMPGIQFMGVPEMPEMPKSQKIKKKDKKKPSMTFSTLQHESMSLSIPMIR